MKNDLTPAQERILNWLLEQHRKGNLKEHFLGVLTYGGFGISDLEIPDSIQKDMGPLGLDVLVDLGYFIRKGDTYAFTAKCFTSKKEIDRELRQAIFPRRKLRKSLVDHFSISELHNLCFDLGIDSENLKSQAKDDFIVSLLRLLERNDRIDELIELCKKDKPKLDWSFNNEVLE